MNVLNISASHFCLSVTKTFLEPIQTTREKWTVVFFCSPSIQSVLEALYYSSSAMWTDSICGPAARLTESIFTTSYNRDIPPHVPHRARLEVTNDIDSCYFAAFCFIDVSFWFYFLLEYTSFQHAVSGQFDLKDHCMYLLACLS